MSTTQPTRTAPKKTAPAAKKTPIAAKPTAEGEEAAEETRRRRGLEGVVVSNKMNKTCVVQVIRRFKHPKYKKYVNERQRYKAHDEANSANVGDRVIIVESRPMSKDKRWRLQTVLEKAETV